MKHVEKSHHRAKEILHRWNIESMPTSTRSTKKGHHENRKVEKYGPEDLPAGPGLEGAKEIIVVEGRADVISDALWNLCTVALEESKVPESIKR